LPLNQFATTSLKILAAVVGAGSLLLFVIFIQIGPFAIVRLDAPERQKLLWDALLSLFFFVQHSGMVRASFRAWLSSVARGGCHPSIYTLASGLSLLAVVLLWQTSQTVLFQLQGPIRWLPRAVSLLAAGGFAWGIRALSSYDTCGLVPFLARFLRKGLRPPKLVVRGPFLWMRHPLYFFTMVLIWSVPDLTSDRLLFNSLWTLWIITAAFLEERDLVIAFGEPYRNYQKVVPMLLPWRGPAGRRL
jgi:protein-S-isoprenylcysteine O-methyltransferase Ste14